MARLFRAMPEAIAETLRILERCRFSLDELRYEYPRRARAAGPHARRSSWGADLARARPGAIRRASRRACAGTMREGTRAHRAARLRALFPHRPRHRRLARGSGILCQGRGSAANSAVCYCLGITAVDPTAHDLLFERFVSAERREPPDIDVDFEHERREEVIQYIYRRYGRERAGIAATVISLPRRAAPSAKSARRSACPRTSRPRSPARSGAAGARASTRRRCARPGSTRPTR